MVGSQASVLNMVLAIQTSKLHNQISTIGLYILQETDVINLFITILMNTHNCLHS